MRLSQSIPNDVNLIEIQQRQKMTISFRKNLCGVDARKHFGIDVKRRGKKKQKKLWCFSSRLNRAVIYNLPTFKYLRNFIYILNTDTNLCRIHI